jgi:hypothetical protein
LVFAHAIVCLAVGLLLTAPPVAVVFLIGPPSQSIGSAGGLLILCVSVPGLVGSTCIVVGAGSLVRILRGRER